MSKFSILVTGNAISETILSATDPVHFGEKYTVPATKGMGGSGTNYARRLLTWGADVFPILLVGNDPAGIMMRDVLFEAAIQGRTSIAVRTYLSEPSFMVPGARTLQSTILLANGRRTIFSHEPQMADNFIRHLGERTLAAERAIDGAPSAVMIGHLYGDRGRRDPSTQGLCTHWWVEHFHERAFTLINFGRTQLGLGARFWEKLLEKSDLFQCNVQELGLLFAATGDRERKLSWMIEWLRERIPAVVVTAGHLGALGVCRGIDRKTCMAAPSPLPVKDSTGSGDAFAAGLVSHLAKEKNPTFDNLCQAMSIARTWAAFACDERGGSGPAPGPEFLQRLNEVEKSREPITIFKDPHSVFAAWYES